MSQKIPANFPYESHYIEIEGSKMHYIEQGAGDPILFLHGVPTSSYLWRNIIPHVSKLGRCIALDLIGLGKSDKPEIEYTITDHIHYVEKFIEKMNLKRVVLVLHDWGSVIGFDYAMRHEKTCKGLVFYEAFLHPVNGEEASLPFQEQLLTLQQQENISDLIANGTYFVDKVLSQGTLRKLTEEEMSFYREPFLTNGSGKPLQQYLQELPSGNHQSTVNQIIANYSEKLKQSKLPKLLLYSVPGFITTMATIMWAKQNLLNLEMVEIGEDMHFAQESNPALIGETISVWLQGIEQTTV